MMCTLYSHWNLWAKYKIVPAPFLLADEVLTWESKIFSNAKEKALYENCISINQQLFWAEQEFSDLYQ